MDDSDIYRNSDYLARHPEMLEELHDTNMPTIHGREVFNHPISTRVQEMSNERITVPSHLLNNYSHSGDHYVLRVVGNSMQDETITDGDFIVVLRKDHADDGEMAVVIVGDESTIKRVYNEGESIRLVAASHKVRDITIPTKDVKITGIVVGLMRKF